MAWTFYGRPFDWAPLLSFEVYETAYERELQDATRALYLSFLINSAMDKAENTSKVLQLAIDACRMTINKVVSDVNTLISNNVPALQSAIIDVEQQRNYFLEAAKLEDQYLTINATDSVEMQKWKADSAKSLRLVGAFYTLVFSAVGQPEAGALIGTGVQALADGYNPNGNNKTFWDYLQAYGTTYSAGKEFEGALKDVGNSVGQLDFSSVEALRKSLSGQKSDLFDKITKVKSQV
jgi:hypothetical protein